MTKLLQNNQQPTQLPQIPQFVPQTGPKGTQENVITSPQATNGQGSTTPQRREVVEVAIGVEVVEVEVD